MVVGVLFSLSLFLFLPVLTSLPVASPLLPEASGLSIEPELLESLFSLRLYVLAIACMLPSFSLASCFIRTSPPPPSSTPSSQARHCDNSKSFTAPYSSLPFGAQTAVNEMRLHFVSIPALLVRLWMRLVGLDLHRRSALRGDRIHVVGFDPPSGQ